jgi:cytochrome P450
LFPSPAIGSVRQTGRDISCKNGTMVIPKGATVYLVQYLSHRNSTAFKNPAEFLPNRWDNPTKAMKESIFMFAYGPRNCAGQSLALTELHNIISKLMTSFEMSIEKEGTLMFYTHLKREGTLLKATRK